MPARPGARRRGSTVSPPIRSPTSVVTVERPLLGACSRRDERPKSRANPACWNVFRAKKSELRLRREDDDAADDRMTPNDVPITLRSWPRHQPDADMMSARAKQHGVVDDHTVGFVVVRPSERRDENTRSRIDPQSRGLPELWLNPPLTSPRLCHRAGTPVIHRRRRRDRRAASAS